MRTRIVYGLWLVGCWGLLFSLHRLIFFAANKTLLKGVPLAELAQSLIAGWRLDLSTCAYLLAIPMVFLIIHYACRWRGWLRIAYGFMLVAAMLYNMVAIGEDGLYREWKTKLTMQALLHFQHPDEVFLNASGGLSVFFFGMVTLLTYGFYRLHRRIWQKTIIPSLPDKALLPRIWQTLWALVLWVGIVIIGIRGGLQPIPISESAAYFSKYPILNDVAVNPLWSLGHQYLDYRNLLRVNPFKVMDDSVAQARVKALYASADTLAAAPQVLTTARPNIVFLLLESWSATCSQFFGGDNFTPFLDSLAHTGIGFTQIYPAAYVSDQGIPAVLSSYPSTARISIVNQPAKSLNIPCINQDLAALGYQSGFIFGGDLTYGNIKSYLVQKQWQTITDEQQLDKSLPRARLGVHDGVMATQLIQALDTTRAPFVYGWFTVSSHMPYDIPVPKIPLVNHKENDYVNSMQYADASLRQFFAMAKTRPWFKNTLFILVADHSHASHKDYPIYHKGYHHIPLVWWGDVVAPEWRGKRVAGIGSQVDIVPTLLYQMGLPTAAYEWGKNLLQPRSPQFAFYPYHSGGGWVTPAGFVAYQKGNPNPVIEEIPDSTQRATLRLDCQAYQQSIYADFMRQ